MPGYVVNFLGKCIQNQQNISCTVPNCVGCMNSPNVCTNCFNGYSPANNGSCVANTCNAISCRTCINATACQSCQQGYQLDSNNICQSVSYGCNIKNCQTCSSGQSCSQCALGYQLTPFTMGKNIVYLCKQLVCPFNITNCNACVPKYNTIWQYNQIMCDVNSCASNYVYSNGYCVPNLQSVQYNCSGAANCLTCSSNNFCSQCASGYSLTLQGTCQMNTCYVENCQSCSVNNVCQQCNSGYTLTNGNLLNIQPSDYINFNMYIATQQCSKNSPFTCNVNNCLYCMNQDICSACASGYSLTANGAICTASCNVTNCYACTTNNLCISCNPGFTLSFNQATCTASTFNCSMGCVNGSCQYNWNTMMGECTQCTVGMLLYNGQCISSTCNIQGCVICSPWDAPNTNCLQCQQSLILSDGYCIQSNCADSTPNCGLCIENNKCLGCKAGYLYQVLTNGTIQCVNSANISKCNVANCLSCNPNNSSQCLNCASPYTQFNGQCVCKFQNCLDCSQSVLTCNSCPAPLFGSVHNPNCVPRPSLINTCNVNNC